MKMEVGKLIMASHSIGHNGDIPARSLDALRTADLLIFEEDRGARAALKSAGIHRPYLRYSEHNQTQTIEILEENLRDGKVVVYMSDQGCPGLADPGREIVKAALRQKARLTTIPGPSSLTAAIAVCPFDLGSFHFGGFAPRETAERENQLGRWSELGVPVVIMDTPYRLSALLDSCRKVYGDAHRATLALDISGENESILNESLGRLATQTAELGKLNFVLILDGRGRRHTASSSSRPAPHRNQKPASKSPVRSKAGRRR